MHIAYSYPNALSIIFIENQLLPAKHFVHFSAANMQKLKLMGIEQFIYFGLLLISPKAPSNIEPALGGRGKEWQSFWTSFLFQWWSGWESGLLL
jgi:hypothetical protein